MTLEQAIKAYLNHEGALFEAFWRFKIRGWKRIPLTSKLALFDPDFERNNNHTSQYQCTHCGFSRAYKCIFIMPGDRLHYLGLHANLSIALPPRQVQKLRKGSGCRILAIVLQTCRDIKLLCFDTETAIPYIDDSE